VCGKSANVCTRSIATASLALAFAVRVTVTRLSTSHNVSNVISKPIQRSSSLEVEMHSSDALITGHPNGVAKSKSTMMDAAQSIDHNGVNEQTLRKYGIEIHDGRTSLIDAEDDHVNEVEPVMLVCEHSFKQGLPVHTEAFATTVDDEFRVRL
jgi:hypothetical protein